MPEHPPDRRPTPEPGDDLTPLSVRRSFAFVDLCGFSAFVEEEGQGRAYQVLTEARSAIRVRSSQHGVRVDKWLGDGALLVGTVTHRLVSSVLDMVEEVSSAGPLALRAGLAEGPVMVFEGDDYIGGPINLASKLCHMASPGTVLAPKWLAEAGIPGFVLREESLRQVRGLAGPVPVAVLGREGTLGHRRAG